MTSILFVTESSTRGGVVTVLGHILTQWPETDTRRLLLLHNEGHGGKEFFHSIANRSNRLDIIEVPSWNHMRTNLQARKTSWINLYLIKIFIFIYKILFFLKSILYFQNLCSDQKVEVVFSHSGGYPGGLLNRAAVFGAKLAGVRRICLVVHNLSKKPQKFAFLSRAHDIILTTATSNLIAVSEATKQSLHEYRFPSKEPQVIYNGIPLHSQIFNVEREKNTGVFTLAYVGELSERKGLTTLFQAVASLQTPVLLLVYGREMEAGYKNTLSKLSQTLSIDTMVKFMGFDPDVSEKLGDVDVLVLPSIAYESFGMVLLEAMRHKKPVVVTDIGGMKEVVIHEKTGFVVPAQNADALAAALLKIIGDTDLAKTLGEAGYQRLCKEFTSERMVEEYFSLSL